MRPTVTNEDVGIFIQKGALVTEIPRTRPHLTPAIGRYHALAWSILEAPSTPVHSYII
jgi:hypothetical protein